MPALTADRTPDQLVAELERLIEVDWSTVWAGVPEETDKRTFWCAGFGWRPLWFQAGLWVRTAGGARLYLATTAPGRPVARVEHTAWAARARDTDENERVAELALDRFAAHLAALRGVMGEPTWNGTWADPDFPELPGRSPWYTPEWRLRQRDPHRVAVWRFRTPGAPVFELRLNLGLGSQTAPAPSDARIGLICHSPLEQPTPGPARRI
ncbi:hypothetical protein ABZ865_16685 [Streptomyces sp. NPDC047085]|uniref:hypothetical protein n=1 Tax=Streptomyces sp. NPDC047085 TaxID=3155140 RepID=UPI00340348E8